MELYISWEAASAKALEQYQIIDEKNKRGFYSKRRSTSERFFKMNGEFMEGLGNLRHSIK